MYPSEGHERAPPSAQVGTLSVERQVDKTARRKRRARRARMRIRELGQMRLTVHRTPRHIYAQVIARETRPVKDRVEDRVGDRVVAQASTLDTTLRDASGGNIAAASAVGQLIAERALAAGVPTVAFDRSGYKYHGRVKALADAAREGGLRF